MAGISAPCADNAGILEAAIGTRRRSAGRGKCGTALYGRRGKGQSPTVDRSRGPEARAAGSRVGAVCSGRDAGLVLGRLAQHVAAAPHRLDVVLAVGGVGELLAQLADEDVDDLELGLVHAAVEVVEEHLLGQRRALA